MAKQPFAFRLNNTHPPGDFEISADTLQVLSAMRAVLQRHGQPDATGAEMARQFGAAAEAVCGRDITAKLAELEPKLADPGIAAMSLAGRLRDLHDAGKCDDEQYRVHRLALQRGGKAKVERFIGHMAGVPLGTFREANSAYVRRVAHMALSGNTKPVADAETQRLAAWALGRK